MRSVLAVAAALSVAISPAAARPKVCAECVKGNMEVLAAEAMRGRGCGTQDEYAAARFIADRLQRYGVQGAGPAGGYEQRVEFRRPTYASAPTLQAGTLRLTHGREMVAIDQAPEVSGPLIVVDLTTDPSATTGKVALLETPYDPKAAAAFFKAGAVAVVAPVTERVEKAWAQLADRAPGEVEVVGAEPPGPPPARAVVFARPEAIAALKPLAGQRATISAPRGEPLTHTTHNVLGVVHGTAPDADSHAILLSAHYDHIGVRGGVIYPGANDDASGTAAVLEFARLIGQGKAPKRTVHFAFFGCEEEGGHGARYYLAHPPTSLSNLAVNLEFEMIGVPDPKDRKALMLTGWERSNLGPILREKGASLHPDSYPGENFFQRSDNYQLAKKGVVAQTISAWPIPPTYHQPGDDLAHVDLVFMAEVIQSLAGPIRWLANSEFRPEWNPGMQP